MSTSKLQSRSYHHGDLRRALLDAALALVEREGAEDVSLREVARQVGVSPAAVYRHFPDKRALLRGLAEEGVARLAAWQQAAAEQAKPGEAFAATGRAYVRWALANPALFRLAFVQTCPVGETVFGDNEAANLLREFATEVAGDPAATRVLMIQAWAVVHGLAMLMLDGQLPRDDGLIEKAIDSRTLFHR